MFYQDINLNITLKDFQTIYNDLKRYEFITIDRYNENEFMKFVRTLIKFIFLNNI